jgi:hypothetical protein
MKLHLLLFRITFSTALLQVNGHDIIIPPHLLSTSMSLEAVKGTQALGLGDVDTNFWYLRFLYTDAA